MMHNQEDDCNNSDREVGSFSMGRGKKFRHHYPQYQSKFDVSQEIQSYLGTSHRLDNFDKVFVEKPPKVDDDQFENISMEVEKNNGWVPMEFRKLHSLSSETNDSEDKECKSTNTSSETNDSEAKECESTNTQVPKIPKSIAQRPIQTETRNEANVLDVDDVFEDTSLPELARPELKVEANTKVIKKKDNLNRESVTSQSYNSALCSSENFFETALENLSLEETTETKENKVKEENTETKEKKVKEIITLRATIKAPRKDIENNFTKNCKIPSLKAKLVMKY